MLISICEDDSAQLNQHKNQIEFLCRKHNIEAKILSYSNGEAFLFDVEDAEKQPDLAVFDIYMPGPDGVQVAERLRELESKKSEILFVTHSNEHWRQAFKLKAIDYIIKDELNSDEFEEIFLTAYENINKNNAEVLTLTCGGKVCNIPIKDISYFEVSRNIVTVHYKDLQSFDFYTTMSNLEERLSGYGFVRIHKSFLVEQNHIKMFSRSGVQLVDGTELAVGRAYYQKAKTLLENAG